MSPHDTRPTQDLAIELSRPVDSFPRDLWYDVEAGCYVEEALSLSLEEQEGSAASTPTLGSSRFSSSSHGSSSQQINENNYGMLRSTLEEPVGHSPTLQEEAVEATRDNEPDQQAEKGRAQSMARGTRCVSKAMNHGDDDDDDEEPRPAKRRRSSAESCASLENRTWENSDAQS